MTFYQQQRAEIEKQFIANGIHADFSGYSDAHGLSIYYNVDGKKVRFSTHSVTSVSRMFDEVHFDLPIVKELKGDDVVTRVKDLSRFFEIRGLK